MTSMQILTPIASASASPEEARQILAAVKVDQTTVREMVVALRSFVWKALNQRRRDSELAQWHDLLKRTKAKIRAFETAAGQVQILADLLSESIAIANSSGVEDVLKRRHAREILTLLSNSPRGELSKEQVMRKLDLKQANLWRLMELLTEADLVQRSRHGKEAIYSLTPVGRRTSANLEPTSSSDTDYFGLILDDATTPAFEERFRRSIRDLAARVKTAGVCIVKDEDEEFERPYQRTWLASLVTTDNDNAKPGRPVTHVQKEEAASVH